MLGNFDETVSVKDFLHHADTGIGTCAGLDGEAVFEDGVAYKATADGKVIVRCTNSLGRARRKRKDPVSSETERPDFCA